MKKILVPVELSHNSEALLNYANYMFGLTGAVVHLFHVAQLPDFYVSDLEDYKPYEKELKEALGRISSASMSHLQEMRVKYFKESSSVECVVKLAKNIYNEILDFAEYLNPDLILMGSSTDEKYEKIRIGSNTERVIRLTKTPVVVINKLVSNPKLKKIVFASDFQKESVENFKFLDSFLTGYNASVRLLYINTKANFEEYEVVKDRIEKFKKNFKGDFSVVIRAGKNIEPSIVRYANSINADLIALGVKNKKGFSLYFTDKTTEGVVNLSDIPVLVINNSK
jgi:nucleotide-binding universal stress UspA family protein